MKAIRSFLREEVMQAKLPSTTSVLLKSPEQIQAEFDEALKINDEWNAECAKVRAVRIESQMKEQEPAKHASYLLHIHTYVYTSVGR